MALSKATSAFADAMETCAGSVEPSSWPARLLIPHRLKGPTYEVGTKLQAASGLHHLMGNHWHILVCTAVLSASYSTDGRTGRDVQP
jgi:hypothetical protein